MQPCIRPLVGGVNSPGPDGICVLAPDQFVGIFVAAVAYFRFCKNRFDLLCHHSCFRPRIPENCDVLVSVLLMVPSLCTFRREPSGPKGFGRSCSPGLRRLGFFRDEPPIAEATDSGDPPSSPDAVKPFVPHE